MDDYFINVDLTTEEGKASYISEISRIKSSSQSAESKLSLLDLLIRDFLRKRFHTKKTAEYSEMIEFFLEKNKPHIAVFCHSMIKQLYAGDSNDQNSVSLLLEEAKRMIDEEMFGHSEEEESKPSKGLFSRIFGSKNKKEEKESTSPGKVGKQTEKIIEKTLSPQITNKSGNGMPKKSNDFLNSLRSKLDISLIENDSEEQEEPQDEEESIQNIDDLERIKKKIAYKKQILAKEKLKEEKEAQKEQEEEIQEEKYESEETQEEERKEAQTQQ